jgi:choline dehydrogenase
VFARKARQIGDDLAFDYIIVGAGSAGCTLAARLLEKKATVLLLEAGRRERLNLTRVPAMLFWTVGNPRYDWKYQTEPDPSRNGLTEPWPRGRVPGGSSAINGMIFIRGAAADYDAWEAMGNAGWGWHSVLPYFRQLETTDIDPGNGLRGGMGPQHVSALRWRHPVSAKFIDSFREAGIPFNPDLNGQSHEGVAWNQGSTRRGARHSAFDAFLGAELQNPDLRFLDDALVERVLLEGRRATGVRFSHGQRMITATARAGVVLSAGTINTPQLLMLSGIGDPVALSRLGIAPVVDSPEVGRNLMEHPALAIRADLDIPTGNRHALGLGAVRAGADWLFNRRGFLSGPIAQVLAFLRSDAEQQHPDLQFHLFPIGYSKKNGKMQIPRRDLVTIMTNVNYPKSRGHLALRSADFRDPIAIHPNMLGHDDDVAALLRGLGWVRRIARTAPFGDHVRSLLEIPPEKAGPEADEAYIRRAALPNLHPVGTCRMGIDDRAVVTPALRVRGSERLWVADASIFPRHIAGNTNATALMIGARAGDLIHP